MLGCGNTQPLQDGKKNDLSTHRGGGDVKTFQLSLVLELVLALELALDLVLVLELKLELVLVIG